MDNENKHVNAFLKPDQVSLAIGRRGVNIKLAQELTGYMIDVFRDTEGEPQEFDIDLDEFSDEIETWIIDEFKRVGCDTARSVLDLTAEKSLMRGMAAEGLRPYLVDWGTRPILTICT